MSKQFQYQVLEVIKTLMSGLTILERKGETVKESYETNNLGDGKHYYGSAYKVGRKLIIIAEAE